MLSVFAGDTKAYPVYITLANIERKIRNSPGHRAILTLALLPELYATDAEKVTEAYRISKLKLLHKCMKVILKPLMDWAKRYAFRKTTLPFSLIYCFFLAFTPVEGL